MIETGKILQQRYRIDRQIGQGGMGAVYVATDERFGSTVAIKETLCMDDNYRKALEREARLLNSLKHTALPRVSDHFLESNGQFLVMEYIPGEDLCSIQEKQDKPFAIEQVLDWADQLLDALDFLHNQANPVIHRDIKPQNLKITPRGQIVLLDFGLAKGNVTGAGNQTAAKSIFGYSRNYASLEQIQGTGTDPRSDLYSLAATLYHLAANVPPEDALSRAMAVLNHQPDPLVPANSVEPSIPAGVAAVLHRAMDLNAAGRPASAAEMREMLRHHEGYKTEFVNAATRAVALGDVHGQATRLMPGTTRQEADRQTHIKTQVLPEYISQETSVRGVPGVNAAAKKQGWRSPKVLAGAALVAIACGGGVFYSEFLHQNEQAPAAAPVVADAPAEATIPAANMAAEPSPEAAAPPPAKTQTVKSAKSSPASKKKAPTEQTEIVTPDGDVFVGNTRIHNGVIETPDVFIDENGIRRRVPRANVPPVPIDPKAMPYLTPAQREKLRMLNRRNFRVVVPTPSPQ